ncbi:uncharacterized protein RJT21DRAFT_119567 [Scheffersomyces amazonensis]|uniref:uncharacterized protein n=1 Tax=Scheffersomyces amazonensis TaxID=1078765 RepID=UPI00315C4DED
MAPKVREDLVVPYRHVPAGVRAEASSVVSQSLPMAAMFMRNKMLSWAAVFLAVQSYLNEPINAPKKDSDSAQPPLLRIGFAFISLVTCYIDLIFPAANPAIKKAADVTAAVTSSIASASSTA